MRRRHTTGPGPAPALGRRAFLAGGLAAAGTTLAGCGPADTVLSGRQRLRQWNLFTGGDGARMVEMHEAYRKQHPGIDFQPSTFQWGNPYYTKFAMGAAGGRAFDVATLHVSRLRGLGAGTLISPVPTDLLAQHGITRDTITPNIWDKCTIGGELYAIPLDTHLMVNYFNRPVCEEAGVLDADGDLVAVSDEDEFFEVCAAVKEVTGQYGVVLDTTHAWRPFWSLYRQLGGELALEGELGIDDDKALRALEFLRRVSQEGLAPKSSDGAATPANFQNGIAGLMLSGNWEMPTLKDAGMDFGMRPFPGIYGEELGQGDSHCFVLPVRREPDEDAVAAAVEYAAWMLKHSISWAGGGHVPAYTPVTGSQEYADLQPQANYRRAAENVQFDPSAWFSGSAAQLQADAGAIFTGVHTGAVTPKTALHRFKRAAQNLIETPAPV